jgi:hypothetical protein
MEWWCNDPERGDLTKWWSINPQTGQPDGDVASERIAGNYLSDCALDAVSEAADAIATTFATECFADEEVSALILRRVVPPSFQGGVEDAADLLDLVDGLWTGAELCYRQALRRLPTQVERQWLYAFTFDILRARQK